MRSNVYQDFMQNESWRGRETRFGYSAESFQTLLLSVLKILSKEQIEPKNISEFGCGTALHLIDIARRFSQGNCWGFEPAGNMFDFAYENLKDAALENTHILRFSVEDIPSFFNNAFDLTFSILVGTFTTDFRPYMERIFKLGSRTSVHIFLEVASIEDLGRSESNAVDDFLREVIEMEGRPQSATSIFEMARDIGFSEVISPASSTRFDPARAQEIHSKKDRRRAEKEESICSRHGLEPWFLSSVIPVRQFTLVKR